MSCVFLCGFNDHFFNTLNTKLNSICHLLVLLGAHPILHVSRIRVNYEVQVCTQNISSEGGGVSLLAHRLYIISLT